MGRGQMVSVTVGREVVGEVRRRECNREDDDVGMWGRKNTGVGMTSLQLLRLWK
jgi:hypothetical protein